MDDATVLAFLDALFHFGCGRKVSELIDAERILAGIDRASDGNTIADATRRYLQPLRARVTALLLASDKLVGDWVPEHAQGLLADWLGRPAPIPKPLIDELVASERVRDAVRQMLQESLSNVLGKAVKVAPGGRSLKGVMGLAGAAGRGILGGLGDEIQRQLEERVRDFVDSGVNMVQQRLAVRLASDETAKSLGQRRKQFFLELMKRKESEAGRLLGGLPHELIEGLLPVLAQHNLQRVEVRAALRAEIEAQLAELSTQTIGEILDEAGLRELVHTTLRERGLPFVRAFMVSQEFVGWLSRR